MRRTTRLGGLLALTLVLFPGRGLSAQAPDTPDSGTLPAVVQALVEGLRDAEVQVRTASAEALARHKYPAVVAALGRALEDKDGRVRRAAADALGQIGDKSAADALVRHVAGETWQATPTGFFRYDPRDPPPYDGHDGWGSKDHALKALRQLAPERAAAALAQGLKAKAVTVRQWSADGLAAEKGVVAVQALCAALKDDDGQVRRSAARSLGTLGDRTAVPALTERVRDEIWFPQPRGLFYYNENNPPAYDGFKDWGSKEAALQALRRLAPDQVEAALLAALKAKNPSVRKWAAEALTARGEKKK